MTAQGRFTASTTSLWKIPLLESTGMCTVFGACLFSLCSDSFQMTYSVFDHKMIQTLAGLKFFFFSQMTSVSFISDSDSYCQILVSCLKISVFLAPKWHSTICVCSFAWRGPCESKPLATGLAVSTTGEGLSDGRVVYNLLSETLASQGHLCAYAGRSGGIGFCLDCVTPLLMLNSERCSRLCYLERRLRTALESVLAYSDITCLPYTW